MKVEFVNPFEGYGGAIKGYRFIGREEAINAIRAKLINSEEPGNIAIIGMPRIGKSSLIWNALEEIKEDLIKKKLLPVWIDTSEYEQKEHLFCAMVKNCANELEDLGLLTAKLNNLKNQILDERNSWFSRFDDIKRFFKFVKNENFNVIILLDEFDNTEKIFQESVTGFQKLRTLYNYPDHRIYYVIASRRKIVDIENIISSSSTFHEVVSDYHLGMFHEKDLEEYFKRFLKVNIALSKEDIDKILFYCGGHPFLLDILCCEIVNIYFKEQTINIEEAAIKTRSKFIENYNHTIRILHNENNLLSKLIQLIIGPKDDVTPDDIYSLLSYGLIKKHIGEAENSNPLETKYTCYSDLFYDFLVLVEREFELLPTLCKTEVTLRRLIQEEMIKVMSENWITKIRNRKSLMPSFDKAFKNLQKSKNHFGSRASDNILDYMYPGDLFKIITDNWSNVFEKIFGWNEVGKKRDKTKHWESRFGLIARIRNEEFHIRPNVLRHHEKLQTEGYCEEILSYIQRYQEKIRQQQITENDGEPQVKDENR